MSTFAHCSERPRFVTAVATALLFCLSMPALADDHEAKKIRALGNPVTAFSTEPADSPESLRRQFEEHAADYKLALEQAGWEGNWEDLLNAVNAVKASDRVILQPGDGVKWMVFRKNKQPVITRNLVWDPKWAPKGQEQQFDAWQIEVESNCKVYTFLVPVVCVNLALYKDGVDVTEAPSCSLTASAGAAKCDEFAQISLSGSTDGTKLEITNVEGGSSSGLSASGNNSWTYAPSSAGSYTFTATATSACGQTATCKSNSVNVAAVEPCVKCAIKAMYDEESRTITITDDGSVGSLDVTGITLPDGTSGEMSKLIGGDGRWTYTPKRHRKPGSYTWTFAAQAERNGKTADCEARVTRDVPEPDYAWIFRAFGARVDADGSIFQSSFLPNGSNLRDDFQINPGTGFGASIERVFTPRIGLELGLLLADLDSVLLRDIDVDWEQSEEDIGMTLISLGPNFHLTPGSSVDLFIGPFLGYVELDSVTHRVLGSNVRFGGEDEFTFGAQIGIDVPTSSTWAFTAGIKWLDLDYDLDDGDDDANEVEIGIDPLIFTAGVAYRF